MAKKRRKTRTGRGEVKAKGIWPVHLSLEAVSFIAVRN